MREKDRKRYELAFDPSADEEFIALVEDFRDQGYAVMDVFRMALRLLAGGTSEARADDLEAREAMQTDIEDLQFTLQAVIQEQHAIRADMETLAQSSGDQDALARLEQKFDQLAHTVDQLSLKVETLQLTGGPLADGDALPTPLADPDAGRQSALSAKLKRMKFQELQ